MNPLQSLSADSSSFPRLPLAWLSVMGLELRLWVATCVTGLAAFCAAVLGAPSSHERSLVSLLVVFFSTLALYNLDGSLDAPGRGLSRRAQRAHVGLTAASLVIVGFLTSRLAPSALLLTALGLGACSLYAVPLAKKKRSPRLKTLPYLKAPFVGTSVAVAVVWVPLAGSTSPRPWSHAVGLTVVLALYCTANALLFDIPDREEDRRQRTPTIAARHGITRARRTSALLCVGALFALLLLRLFDPSWLAASPGASLGLGALGVYLIAASSLLDEHTRAATIAWLVDGGLLLPLVFLAGLT